MSDEDLACPSCGIDTYLCEYLPEKEIDSWKNYEKKTIKCKRCEKKINIQKFPHYEGEVEKIRRKR